MPRNWTAEQKQAIEARGGTLLVSAAAGSGKTAVLVERVIGRLTGETPCDADRLLVVTFTSAAAAEMKERISQRLAELLYAHPLDENLRRQQILMENAHISTIHSFCLDLIKEYFEQLNLPPDFRIADENEIRALENDTLSGLFEERYSAEDGKRGPFTELSELLGAGRDDSSLEDTVLRLYDFLRSLPDPEGWLDEKLRMYSPQISLPESAWGAKALEQACSTLNGAAEALQRALAVIGEYEELKKAYESAFSGDLLQVENAAKLARDGCWDELFEKMENFRFERLGSPRKFPYPGVRDGVKNIRDGVKDTVSRMRKGLICCTQAEYQKDIRTIYPLAACLFETVLELDKRLRKAKLEKNVLDFGDLEQYALRLLTDDSEGRKSRSPAAEAVSRCFEEILVDEYQDTNPIQDAIFRAVSKDGRNLFMVGDVKQSIYRFRKATPELFLEEKENYLPYGEGFPSKIILGRNFRSRSGVTDTVNFFFSQLMSKSFGEIEYGAEEELIAAAEYPQREGPDFSLRIIDVSNYEENDGKEEIEARHIAKAIRKMISDGLEIKGENGLRPASFRDFCILLRSTSGRAEKYRQELENAGVPAYADVTEGYLGAYEVSVMLSLLRVLDNPLQDVPLLSVMLSPVFGFTPDDLAGIRIRSRKGSLYLALQESAGKEADGRFREFTGVLDELRRIAAVLPADRLILRIYEQTGFESIFEAMPGGGGRRANLRLLLDYARNYEAAGYRGLSGFIRFIDRVGEQQGDLAPASAVPESADVVRIMSIHKSKGLEFPVCILAGCSKRFNTEDTKKPALFHPVYGFGSQVRGEDGLYRYTTLPREVVRMETEKGNLAEEMRVLYVAMTRAKEKLCCFLTLSNPDTAFKKAAGFLREGSRKLDPLAAAQAQSFSDWILACALRHPDAGAMRKAAGLEDLKPLDCPARWEVRIDPAEAAPVLKEEKTAEEPTVPDPELLREIKRRAEYVYPFRGYTKIPSKAAVSELAEKGSEEFDASADGPSFLKSSGLTPAQAGTALHSFMQHASFDIRDSVGIENEIGSLLEARYLLPEEAAAIDREKVLAFLNSPLCGRIRSAKRVWRELRFNIEADAGELYADLSGGSGRGETIVLQGMADVVFEENSKLYLLDYKTDRAGEEQLMQRYSLQLKLYAHAVKAVLGREVSGCWLYGFYEGKTIEVPANPPEK